MFPQYSVGGVLVETSIEEPNSSPFHFVFASVGDCKAFRYNARDRKVTDLTPGNRLDLTDPRDPGGRLGKLSSLSLTSIMLSLSSHIASNFSSFMISYCPRTMEEARGPSRSAQSRPLLCWVERGRLGPLGLRWRP